MSTGILCMVQARMSSSRLPGKVLAPLLGRPLLTRQVERLGMSRRIDDLCVATSTDPSDQAIADCCRGMGVPCYRGDLDDVLDRFYQAALTFGPAQVVRITGDCPLLDPDLVDAIIEQHLREQNDYTSNVSIRSFPDGLDVEVFSFTALARAWKEAGSHYEREHVTPFFYRDASGFRCGVYRDEVDRSSERWVVDYPEDLEFVRRIYAALYPRKPDFRRADVHQLLEARPDLVNAGARRI